MFLFGPIVTGCFAGITCIFTHVDVHRKGKLKCCVRLWFTVSEHKGA